MPITTSTVAGTCPYCNQSSDIGKITTEKISILLCSSCHKCWEVLNGKAERLIKLRHLPESDDEFTLCPVCWREMQADYDGWVVRCPDPICGFEKRLHGQSKRYRMAREAYYKFRKEVFEQTDKGEVLDSDTLARLKLLREEFESVSKQEKERGEQSGRPNQVEV